ncbi:hypothetical protein [Pseudomonas frederiksbergensis]|uniref:DUF2158 domain-containing protein n=1 Tax=Pseudomonas frederiksbergensis TaxID=104087 RepID=A0A423KGM0_9PSED|nr:hypothetical protein [Pseudomonas frederiksbergensis]RON51961.1 hypothetical protein BK665_17250 [Pseudomonas frederiksbergensis]
MNTFEPGEYVRLRAGGRKMIVKHPSFTSDLPGTPLVPCEYREKKRTVLGFYSARDLIVAPA